ncbi:hypothetical protein AGMMS49574_01510 [Bacteroidia bacterium]|nr:hypothetical protein AGMMS49574_01510 [Bacteroidia bacterium]
MADYEEIIKRSQDNVKSLSEKLKDLDRLYQEIKALKEAAEETPAIFTKKFDDIVKLSEDYTNTLGAATKSYLDGSNTLFTIKLNELSSKIDEFEKEITRLVNTDFTKLFEDLQEVFIDQTRKDLEKELKRFEEKSILLQAKTDELKKQIVRLEGIDLERHFDKLQKILAEIFGAINVINLTLANIIQALTGIVQSLGTIQTSLDTNHKEAKQLLNRFSEATEKHLTGQDKQRAKNEEMVEKKLESLSKQNEMLKKELRMNRIIQIVEFTVIIITLIYLIVK